jgi:histone H3/H4
MSKKASKAAEKAETSHTEEDAQEDEVEEDAQEEPADEDHDDDKKSAHKKKKSRTQPASSLASKPAVKRYLTSIAQKNQFSVSSNRGNKAASSSGQKTKSVKTTAVPDRSSNMAVSQINTIATKDNKTARVICKIAGVFASNAGRRTIRADDVESAKKVLNITRKYFVSQSEF